MLMRCQKELMKMGCGPNSQINQGFGVPLPKDRASVCRCYNTNVFLCVLRRPACVRVKPCGKAKLKRSSSCAFLRVCAAVVVGFGFPMGLVRNGCNRAAHSKRLWKHMIGEESRYILGARGTP